MTSWMTRCSTCRRVVRLPDDVYVIEDRVTGICREEHDIRLYYNFAFGHLDGENGKFDYTSQKGRRYTMAVQADKKLDLKSLRAVRIPSVGGSAMATHGVSPSRS